MQWKLVRDQAHPKVASWTAGPFEDQQCPARVSAGAKFDDVDCGCADDQIDPDPVTACGQLCKAISSLPAWRPHVVDQVYDCSYAMSDICLLYWQRNAGAKHYHSHGCRWFYINKRSGSDARYTKKGRCCMKTNVDITQGWREHVPNYENSAFYEMVPP